ncbi:MAG TPA: hypothetical protein ENJ82_16045, partial [Bacteroidetes bacterium]|nr:hypothetical protein [Bacteroidota bacterium]
MKILYAVIIAVFSTNLAYAQSFDEKYTTASNVGLTVSNLGIIGNAFNGSFDLEGFPSCKYPKDSDIEHIFDGGLWVGAKINGVTDAVTTGALDASSGYSTGRAGFEFSAPVGSQLLEKSSLFDSPVFDPSAVSHQDFIADFADTAIIVPGTNTPILDHNDPLDISVHMESYNWNFPFADYFVILNFRITNIGNQNLEDVYIGYWTDCIVRNLSITNVGSSGFFSRGGNGYIDSLHMAYEFDADPNLSSFTSSYVSTKFLGATDKTGFRHPKLDTNFRSHYSTWQFNNSSDPLYFFPQDDFARYAKMSNGLNFLPQFQSQIIPNIRTPSNRTHLVSTGPYANLAPGDYIDVAFAIVLAKKANDGQPAPADTDEQKSILIQ